MKLIIWIIGILLSVWVSYVVYTPTQKFVNEIQWMYIKSKVIQKTFEEKTDTFSKTFTESYKEVARVFWIKAAEENIKKEITETTTVDEKNAIEKLFSYNIALWVSIVCGFLTLSVYLNIIGFISFFLKPITFFMK